MKEVLHRYKQAREEFLGAVAVFPPELRERPLFGDWSLKDVLAHIIGWEVLSVEKAKAVRKGIVPEWVSDVEEQNRKAVEQRGGFSWDEVQEELVRSGESMLSVYQSFPPDLWDKQAGPDVKFTPRHFLEQEAGHYESHLQEIRAVHR